VYYPVNETRRDAGGLNRFVGVTSRLHSKSPSSSLGQGVLSVNACAAVAATSTHTPIQMGSNFLPTAECFHMSDRDFRPLGTVRMPRLKPRAEA
jgi:hypothetical protein